MTTHQWIQGYLRKAFSWFFREVFELKISPIPILASSFQGLSDEQVKFSLWLMQQLTLEKAWFWATYLTDNKTFLPLRNFDFFFLTKFVPIDTCFEPSKDILELVLKTTARVWIHFSWFLNKTELQLVGKVMRYENFLHV